MSFKNYVISLRGAIQPIFFLIKLVGCTRASSRLLQKSVKASTFMALRTSMSSQVSVNYDTHTHTLFLSRSLSLSQTHTHSHTYTYTSMLLRGDCHSTLTKRGPGFLLILKKQKSHTKFSCKAFFHIITENKHLFYF